MSVHDEVNDQIRREHVADITQSATGWSWSCSCGKRGKGGNWRRYRAEAGRQQHLRNEWKKLLRAAGAIV